MTCTTTLIDRNNQFSRDFNLGDLPILPKLRTIILACGDSRVDPAHILGIELGDAVVMRNNGGRVTPEVIDEIAALAFMVAKMEGDQRRPFELVIVQHTQCGAERFADRELQEALRNMIGVDVSQSAISDHRSSLQRDIELLRSSPKVPDYIVVSGYLYDVNNGTVEEIVAPCPLSS